MIYDFEVKQVSRYYRFACAVPLVRTADISYNTQNIADLYRKAAENKAAAVLFPGAAIGGYGCGQLCDFSLFAEQENSALEELAKLTENYPSLLVLGTSKGKNAVLTDGQIFFADSTKTVFTDGNIKIAAAYPERWRFDLVRNPSNADVILFPYAECDTYHSVKERRTEYAFLSKMLHCCCIACGAGATNSTAEGVCAGQALAAFDGKVTTENRQFEREPQLLYYDVAPSRIQYMRTRSMVFGADDFDGIPVELQTVDDLKYFSVSKYPFIPENASELSEYADNIIKTSACALANRMVTSYSKKMVLGVSGGLDSTMALITCIECCRQLGLPSDTIVAVSMPGFGTSDRTKDNSLAIAREAGAELRYIPITDAVNQHFKDIGHDPADTNVVYENSQARERTQILMDIANQCGGIVIGTGDLSEIALGWCTYNGDQMSMYAVNASIPKTLMRSVIRHYAASCAQVMAEKLIDICDTPVSPELVPGKQFTEEIIGSYDLHDFFIYNFIKYGDSPETLYMLACKAFAVDYTAEAILNALEVFFRRFFVSQFKRAAMPDAPDVTGIALGKFAMPSDAAGAVWNKAVSDLKNKLK